MGTRDGRRRVIVIDGDPAVREAVARAAARFERQVALAVHASGADALAIAADLTSGLIVVDVHGANGLAAVNDPAGANELASVRAIRAAVDPVTIIAVAAHMTPALERAARTAGADLAVDKPPDTAALARMLGLGMTDVAAGARERMIADHLPFARNIARSLARRYHRLMLAEDVDALARLGLVEAAARFDESRSEPFIAFAETRIRGAVIDELRRQGELTRNDRERRRRVVKLRDELRERGVEPSDEYVAAELGLDTAALQRLEPREYVDIDRAPQQALASADTPELHVERAEAIALVTEARQSLTPLEAAVIHMRYDLELPLQQIATALDLPVHRVVQLQRRVIASLRRHLQHPRFRRFNSPR